MQRTLGTYERVETPISSCFGPLSKTECACAAITAALAALVLLGSLLLYAAQNGYCTPLAFVAEAIDSIWLLASFLLANLALLVDAFALALFSCRRVPVKASGEFEQAFGEKLIQEAIGNLDELVNCENMLLNEEFIELEEILTGNAAYSEVYPLVTRDASGNLRRRYFRSEEAVSHFMEHTLLNNGMLRHNYALQFIEGASLALYEWGHNPEIPLYFIEKHDENGVAQVLTYSKKEGALSVLIPYPKLEEFIQKLKVYQEIDLEQWLANPLTLAELDFLNERVFEVSIEFWVREQRLKERSFVVRNYGRYVAILIWHIEAPEIKFYKINDPAIYVHQRSLVDYMDMSHINPFPLTHDTASPTSAGSLDNF